MAPLRDVVEGAVNLPQVTCTMFELGTSSKSTTGCVTVLEISFLFNKKSDEVVVRTSQA